MATAFAVKFPVLAKYMGFLDDSYPTAVFLLVTDPSLNTFFEQQPGPILQGMWAQS